MKREKRWGHTDKHTHPGKNYSRRRIYSVGDKNRLNLPSEEADFLAPVDDALLVSVGGAVDDLDVIVDEFGGEESVGAKIDETDSILFGHVQEVAPVRVSLHHAP